MYLSARTWGISPSDFWGMTMAEWFTEYRHNSADYKKGQSNLTQAEFEELLELLEE